MNKRRVILTTGNSANQLKRGPERLKSEIAELHSDKKILEEAYPPHKGVIINQGDPLFKGDTDVVFD